MKKKNFRHGLVMAAAAIVGLLGLMACIENNDIDHPDVPDFLAEVVFPNLNEEGSFVVEAQNSEFTFDIKTEGSWRVESDRRFLRMNPNAGTGNAKVTVSVQANQGEEEKVGHLTVVFPAHENKNQALTVEQKCVSYALGADVINTSNKVYAVGFSYDATGEYASPKSVKMEIFDTKALLEDNVLAINATQMSLTENTITGSSISEMTNHLAVKANVKGGFGKFKAEAEASFDMDHAKSSNYEYATTYFDLAVRDASLSKDFEALKDDYMTDDAWNAINGVPVKNKRGVEKIAYPSTNADFKRLIENYGTHVIVDAGLGGRVRYSMEVDISKITSSYDAKAFVKASYENAFVSASGSVDEHFKQSYEDNKKNVTIKLDVLGGDEAKAKALGAQGGFTQANLNSWVNSVTADNMALVSFSKTSLVPLYELVERNATKDNGGFDGEARYQALKAYMEGDQIASDFSTYNCGTVTEIDIPSFADNQASGTLIKDVVIGGQYVGQICEEFIPIINREKRIIVVYPVINNVARYNMGFFLGNDTHKPARISWDGTDVAVEEYADLDFGQTTKLYLRGASVSPVSIDGTSAFPGQLTDKLLEGRTYDRKANQNIVGYYPLVKIFDKVWTRTDYNVSAYGNEGRFIDEAKNICREYYSPDNAKSDIFPAGWKVPSISDYERMKNKLVAGGFSSPGLAMLPGGVVGYDVLFVGWYGTYGWRDLNDDSEMDYWTSDAPYRFVEIYKDGRFNIINDHRPDLRLCVRLVSK